MYPSRLQFKKRGAKFSSVFTYNDFVLTVSSSQAVSATSERNKSLTAAGGNNTHSEAKGNFTLRAYSRETFRPVCGEEIYVFERVSARAQFRLVELHSQLHVLTLC